MTADSFRHWREREAYTLDETARASVSADGWSPITRTAIARSRVSSRSQLERCVWRALIHEAVKLGGVLADDLVPGRLRQMAKLFVDIFLRIRPNAVGVRKVRGPHDVTVADLVDQLDADRVGLIGRVALAAPVFAGPHLE